MVAIVPDNQASQRIGAALSLACLLVLVSACGPDAPADSGRFSLVSEEILDAPIKTQIEQHIASLTIPTKSELESEVLKRYRAAKDRRGFQHHSSPTNIYIYVYGSEEQARAEQGLWIAMLAKSPSDTGEPRVQINEDRLAALAAAPEDRFGLAEATRREVFIASVAAEDRATGEAMARVPDTEAMKQATLEGELRDKYKGAVAEKYSITEEQLRKIRLEGITKGWVMQ